jgi:hypothetical protein
MAEEPKRTNIHQAYAVKSDDGMKNRKKPISSLCRKKR